MRLISCAGALGCGVLKAVWSLGGTIGLLHRERLRVPAGVTGVARLSGYRGTLILAGLAVVILPGLVYPWGNVAIVRAVLRALGPGRWSPWPAWPGSSGPSGISPATWAGPGWRDPARYLPVCLRMLPGAGPGLRRNGLADPHSLRPVSVRLMPVLFGLGLGSSGYVAGRFDGEIAVAPSTSSRSSAPKRVAGAPSTTVWSIARLRSSTSRTST